MNRIVEVGAAVLTTLIGVMALAILVSKNAQTPQVFQAFGQAFTGMMGAAAAPVTGGQQSSMGGLNFTGPLSVNQMSFGY